MVRRLGNFRGARGAITCFCIDASNSVIIEGSSSCVPSVVRVTNKECTFGSLGGPSDGTPSIGLAVRRFCTATMNTSCLVCGKAVSKRMGDVDRLRTGGRLFSRFGTIGSKGI